MGKRLGVVVILALFLLSFASVVVSAESLADKIFSGNSEQFTAGFSSFINSAGFIQFLLFVLVALIVYSIAEILPFIGQKNWVAGVIAIVIAILATFYLKTEEVQSILLSYGALGIALTVIVPFFAIAAVSKKSYEKGYPFLGKMLWVVFIGILLIRVVSVDSTVIGKFGYLLYTLFAIAAIFMFFIENWVYFKIFKLSVKGNISQANRLNIARLEAKRNSLQETLDSLKRGTPEHAQLVAKIQDLDEEIAASAS